METTKHPKQVANDIKRKQEREYRAATESRTAEIVARHGLRFMHVRNYEIVRGDGSVDVFELPNGGMTIAFNTKHKHGKIIKLATALCNPADNFCKRDGRNHAAAAFDRNETILLQKPAEMGVAEFLKTTFDPISLLG